VKRRVHMYLVEGTVEKKSYVGAILRREGTTNLLILEERLFHVFGQRRREGLFHCNLVE
jgi:hypothetical protein